jgi:hypothetical protein
MRRSAEGKDLCGGPRRRHRQTALERVNDRPKQVLQHHPDAPSRLKARCARFDVLLRFAAVRSGIDPELLARHAFQVLPFFTRAMW